MGGDLHARPAIAKSPNFLVAAMKDPFGGNLDRIQIIKGWLDARGGTHEKVYDVAWSDNRKPGRDGKLPAVGNTVDLESVTWRNTIGDPETDDRVERPGLRSAAGRVLLRPSHRDSDASLDGIRGEALRNQDGEGSADDHAGAWHTPRRSGTRLASNESADGSPAPRLPVAISGCWKHKQSTTSGCSKLSRPEVTIRPAQKDVQ